MSGQPWYKHNPRDFLDGIVGMTPDLIGAYIVTLDLIYARGGPIPNDRRWLGGVMGCSSRSAAGLVERLVAAKKLTLEKGLLNNVRALFELKKSSECSRKLAESGAKGGRTVPEKDAKANDNNALEQARLVELARLEEIRIEEEKKKDTTANAVDGEPSQDANSTDVAEQVDDPIDLKALLFGTGKPYLIRNGVTAANAGSIIGKWRQTYGDGAVIDALALAQAEACSAPIPFITKLLEARSNVRNMGRDNRIPSAARSQLFQGIEAAVSEARRAAC
jgi:uncharacterized protein YdaU (DUF1376 family)